MRSYFGAFGAISLVIYAGCSLTTEGTEVTGGFGGSAATTSTGGVDAGPKCASQANCPVNTDCTSYECVAGSCVLAFAEDGKLVATGAVKGDCKKNLCMGGKAVVQSDDTDVVADANACTIEECVNGVKVTTKAADGTSCGGGKLACANGLCEGCNGDVSNCPPPTSCQTATCDQNTCNYTIKVGEVISNQDPKDCLVEVCGMDGNPTMVGDVNENPPQMGDDCKVEKCGSDGQVVQENANEGSVCAGAATACFEASKCESGACTEKPKIAGTFVKDDGTPGNCKADLCDGNGVVLAGVTYDNDAPTDLNAMDCKMPVCMNGAVVENNKNEGDSCSELGGAKCCGATCCPDTGQDFCAVTGCCPSGKACNDICCMSPNASCNGNTCCETGPTCNGQCCPSQHDCQPDGMKPCCPMPQRCGNGTCCPSGKTCNGNMCMG